MVPNPKMIIRIIMFFALSMLAFSPAPPSKETAAGNGVLSMDRMTRIAVSAALAGEAVAGSEHPLFAERQDEREAMVRYQVERDLHPIRDKKVLDAMRRVPRHAFVPRPYQKAAYMDTPLPIGKGQTISQPYIVAFMTEALKLGSDDKVLEIGTGSGYQAAILAEITPHVYTIEILHPLADKAERALQNLGYQTIATRQGDGYQGWKEHAPYDAIIVTCAAGHVPPPLIEQLKPGGRIVIPVGGVYQTQMLMRITKKGGRTLVSEQLLPVRFVPMTGRAEK